MPLPSSSATFVCGLPDRALGICEYNGRLLVATEAGVFRLGDDGKLERLEWLAIKREARLSDAG